MTPLFYQEGHPGAWFRWFAWYPVWINEGNSYKHKVWCKRVYRRRFYAASWFLNGNMSWWEHKELTPLP